MADLSKVREGLDHGLYSLPKQFKHRWNEQAERELHQLLFRSLAAQNREYLRLFFPKGEPTHYTQSWSLREAQGAIDGAEYTAAARGRACGHIFKSGESTYACKTCAADDTCVLCTRCFESSDHEGHQVYISISPGNSGCCDCGDKEAWKKDVICSIHTEDSSSNPQKDKGKVPQDFKYTSPGLPKDLVESVRMTVSRVMDYMCDVFSCSPEQMRLAKTEDSIREDERLSRLSANVYGMSEEDVERHPEFALVLWNDEKHTVDDVTNQVAKACNVKRSYGFEKAMEVDKIGRSIIHYARDVASLLRMVKIIEELKLTATIRSARDIFREQMCAAIIEWIADISGCAVGSDATLLRNVVCEEMLKPWHTGSQAANKDIAAQGLDDHEKEDNEYARRRYNFMDLPANLVRLATQEAVDDNDLEDDDDEQDDEDYDDLDINDDDHMEFEIEIPRRPDADSMDVDFMEEDTDITEVMEAALAGYPAPPPPPQNVPAPRRRIMTPADSDDGDAEPARPVAPFGEVPKTPQVKAVNKRPTRPSRHWLDKPEAFKGPRPEVACEDLWQRVRLDWLILYDLRLWKTVRINLRHLYITTVIVIPHFKRILSLRFAGLYTPLAELYLVADREPDHSIINLSVQMLTTPTITEEVVERGNFLTNLMAILYTFLTTRQVGYPEEVNPQAVLAFDAGTVTNRRIAHFFMDLRWLFQSEYIQSRLRTEPRYLLQFLDLVKLHQGICPNIRATGEHVEYESDAWISASLIIKEVDKLCRQVALAFEPKGIDLSSSYLIRAIRQTAQVAMINSFGLERKRFHQAEMKALLNFHSIGPFYESGKMYRVPEIRVLVEAMSFHHPLHYLLSWLIENAKGLHADTARKLLTFTPADLKDPFNTVRNPPAPPTGLSSDQLLCGLLDPSLRVCAWLAQTKAGLWVRNGITLRHQANSYRGVLHRDIGYQRDLILVQTGLVLTGEPGKDQGEAFLAQIIDRFDMTRWMSGSYGVHSGYEESQMIDILEDLYHLLVIALSERGHLTPRPRWGYLNAKQEASYSNDRILQHDIAHALCFKPLSFSELSNRVTEKVSESDSFSKILESMTNYKAPEGLSDTGSFELKPEFVELIDPYYAHYNRNLREEAENVYRKHMARKTGQKPEDVVFEPRLEPIESGIFQDLSAFTRSALFCQVIFAALDYASLATTGVSSIPSTRIETFLHMVLHLMLIAVLEDKKPGVSASFTSHAATEIHNARVSGKKISIVQALMQLTDHATYASCHPAIKHILRQMLLRQPERLSGLVNLAQSLDRSATDSPASLSVEERERKKQEALARQARVMAQMKQQQNSFLLNQGLEGYEDDDYEDVDDAMSISQDATATPAKKLWHFPSGTCILCQEATNDQRLFGTFAFFGESNILRTTPVDDQDFVSEVFDTPASLDRPCRDGPCGVSSKNRATVVKTSASGMATETTRQGLSKGFPQAQNALKGPVSTSCGHIMHYACFELYFNATLRRHAQQIARNHPETTVLQEFICPLCKALGNTFLPIVWKSKKCADDSELLSRQDVASWLRAIQRPDFDETNDPELQQASRENKLSQRCKAYVARTFMPPLVAHMDDMTLNGSSTQAQPRYSLRQGYSISSLFRMTRSDADTAPLRPQTSGGAEQSTHAMELVAAYARARETVVANKLATEQATNGSVTATGSTFARALGMSISAAEIAHRGMSVMHDGTILNDLSEQTVTHLRILAETFDSYYGVEVLQPTTTIISAKTGFVREQIALQMMLMPHSLPQLPSLPSNRTALLHGDVFLYLNDYMAFFNPEIGEAFAIMQLCLWAEIVKVILAFRVVNINRPRQDAMPQRSYSMSCAELYKIAPPQAVKRDLGELKEFQGELNISKLTHMRELIDKYALTFLRKCLILVHIRFGLSFDRQEQPEVAELDRLLQLLHLQPIADLFDLFVDAPGEGLRMVTRHWIAQATGQGSQSPAIAISHPAIFELVGLPKHYDTLTDEAMKRRCPTTGKEITDPVCCLFCGAIFCSQAMCCLKNKRGGSWQHMQTCGNGKLGMLISIRKCMVIVMHGNNASFIQAPYLDRHGEPDPGLRRHQQLFLNQKRYDKLMREVWLQHGIQNVISRKLEGDNNPGGWETL